ncbi:nuclear transport factor 2 family protein [Luethyella okanaganae]|uniref:Nuclear transport factor 2 family protein n=1 Tax=Luethyella okanaganae TaxID=69372 RepID=A0ABW1VC36_9MICO
MNDVITHWIDGYRRAWDSNAPDDIRALFTEDAEYRTRPHAKPWHGRDEIVAKWIEVGDEPNDYTFEWQPVVVTDDTAVVQAKTDYVDNTYHNLWVIRLAPDGRATSFTEWWMEEPRS